MVTRGQPGLWVFPCWRRRVIQTLPGEILRWRRVGVGPAADVGEETSQVDEVGYTAADQIVEDHAGNAQRQRALGAEFGIRLWVSRQWQEGNAIGLTAGFEPLEAAGKRRFTAEETQDHRHRWLWQGRKQTVEG